MLAPRIHRMVAVALAAGAAACSGSSTTSTGSSLRPVGSAHLAHLRGSAMSTGGTCADCHAPTGFAVDFSQNPMVNAQGARFDPSTKTCSNVYCHGKFTYGSMSGSGASPSWNDSTPATCASCHGMPPAGHPPLNGTVTAATCSSCHPQSIDTRGMVVAAGTHLNGSAETSGLGCTTCHGDATRTANMAGTDVNLPSSPPVASRNAPASAVGAHLGHVNPVAAKALMAPVACSECHVVPGDSTHATNPPVQPVVFGSLSRTGGAAPTWNPGTAGCAASYCHGTFSFNGVRGSNATPVWTDGAPLTCASCHGMPPTGHPAYTGTPDAASCYQCHPQSMNADGTIKQGGGHLNGKAEGGGCTSCHGDPPATGRHLEENHVGRRCDACHPAGYTSSSAVPAFHANDVVDLGAQAGYRCNGAASLRGCPTGQTRTCVNTCHSQSQGW
jgi:predicted CxxxxCH...CXXCH cytochrome family protein